MSRPEHDEVEAARAQHEHLLDDRDLDPSFEGRPDAFGVAAAQLVTKQAVVEPVLDGERGQESDQAETQVGAVAQCAPTPSRCGGSGCKPAP